MEDIVREHVYSKEEGGGGDKKGKGLIQERCSKVEGRIPQ